LIDQFGFFWGVGGTKALVVGGLGVFIAVYFKYTFEV
jgi:hypothetical protein